MSNKHCTICKLQPVNPSAQFCDVLGCSGRVVDKPRIRVGSIDCYIEVSISRSEAIKIAKLFELKEGDL